ncbi:MAG: hypothetical protein GY809_18390 [Planctomycetes bacterium]|nr:hypothetical protein [Planctomycetota bacterium]
MIHGPVGPMDENLKTILFTSVRELVTNAVRHATPNRIRVHIDRQEESLSVCVEDDGMGFDPGTIESRSQKGFGLFSIRERLDYLGGCLDLVSLPGHGCKAVLKTPLTHERN